MNLALRVQNDILNERLKELHLKLEKKQSEVISKLIQTDPIPTDAVPLPTRDSDKLVTCRLVDYPDSDTMSDQGSNFPLLHENPSDITADVVAEDLISTALTRADVQLSEAGAVESPEAALADNLMCSGADSQVPMEAIGTSDSWGEMAESHPSTSGTTDSTAVEMVGKDVPMADLFNSPQESSLFVQGDTLIAIPLNFDNAGPAFCGSAVSQFSYLQ